MPEAGHWLGELAAAATVHFTADAPGTPRMWGSGFFVAPGLIVTCAHVLRVPLRVKRDTVFLVRGDGFQGGLPARARLAASLWDLGDEGPIPTGLDLAVVRLEDPAPDHECVWLADWAEQPAGDRRTVLGYVPRGEDGEGAGEKWSAATRVAVHEGTYGRRFDESEVRIVPGLSGGPVLDPAAGAVVGVTKSRRPDDLSGGLSIATTALRRFDRFDGLYQEIVREHDTWHERRRSGAGDDWIARQSALAGPAAAYDGSTWTPEDRRTALGLLAALSAPEAPYVVITLARIALPRRRVADPAVAPVSWRDGHGELYDGSAPQRAEHFLRYLDDVQRLTASQGRGSRELAEWIERRRGGGAERRPEPLPEVLAAPREDGQGPRCYPGPDDDRPVVILELLKLQNQGNSYDWRLRMGDADGYPVYEGHAVPAEELLFRVSEPLAELFSRVDLTEWPAPLEIALDLGEFHRPWHRWQPHQQANLHERELKELIGVRRPVVMRHLDRLGTHDDSWSARWEATRTAPALTARRTPPRGGLLAKGQLASYAAGEIPVLCRGPREGDGAAALKAAIDAGHGIALWHVDGHPGQRCRESCDTLHAFTGREFARARHATEIPDRLRRIREDISNSNQPHPAEGLALLYDDPRRPAPEDQGVLDSP
ncbi:trypsin-like peptidase domain-containing protein [Streptomyces sp. NPDC004111]|uniref:VMAP-C domain-containing protein n=1 Tax=Streptomyces sp. NPDC004111 TaxID=3364690 RepID=UPI003693F0D8